LSKAERQLVRTDAAAAAIGDRPGFPDVVVFTKFFRQRAGELPTAFCNRARGAPTQSLVCSWADLDQKGSISTGDRGVITVAHRPFATYLLNFLRWVAVFGP
jgi:hypothetical protein